MNYDSNFFEMLKLRGEELFPLEPPFEWYFNSRVMGIVFPEEDDYPWYLSWVRAQDEGIIAAVHPHDGVEETTASSKQLKKMSGDDIVRLLFSHFTFMDKGKMLNKKKDGDEHRPKQDLQHD